MRYQKPYYVFSSPQENEKLKQKINEQIKENNHLIRALDLNITSTPKYRDPPLIGRATSRDLDTASCMNLRDSPVIGTATSYDLKSSPVYGRASSHNLLRDYDSGVFSDEESWECSEDMIASYSESSQANGVHDRQCNVYKRSHSLKQNPPEEGIKLA